MDPARSNGIIAFVTEGHFQPALECLALAGDLLLGVLAARGLAGGARASRGFSILVGIAFGLVVASGVGFVEWVVCGQRSALFLAAEIVGGAGAAFVLRRAAFASEPQPVGPRVPGLLWFLLVGTAVAAALAMFRHVQELPHGDYDAVAIWSKRARSLYLARERFGEVLAGPFAMSQSCYPLFVPGVVDRLWRAGGSPWAVAPVLPGLLAWIAIAVAVGTTVARAASRPMGAVAATVLLGTPFLARNAVDQYADVPVGAFYVFAGCAFVRGHVVLAGACAGAAAWTKNEGLLFVCAFLGATLLVARPRIRSLSLVALGAALPLALLALFKAHAQVGDEYLDRTLGETLRMLFDPARAWMVFREYARELWALGGGLFVGLTALCLVRARRPWPRVAKLVAASLGIMVLGLFVVLVRTPYDLAYDLATTKTRSMIQLWPSWVLAMTLVVRDPWGEREAFSSAPRG